MKPATYLNASQFMKKHKLSQPKFSNLIKAQFKNLPRVGNQLLINEETGMQILEAYFPKQAAPTMAKADGLDEALAARLASMVADGFETMAKGFEDLAKRMENIEAMFVSLSREFDEPEMIAKAQ